MLLELASSLIELAVFMMINKAAIYSGDNLLEKHLYGALPPKFRAQHKSV